MTLRLRQTLLFVMLAGVAAWSVRLALSPRPVPAPGVAVHAQRAHAAARSVPLQSAVADSDRLAPDMEADLFARQTWVVAPPPPPPPRPPLPPAPPQAPALPFVYLGTWQRGDTTTYYLLEGVQLIGAHAGQVLDGVWRLRPANAGRLDFEYLPLKQTRTLRLGDSLAVTTSAVPR